MLMKKLIALTALILALLSPAALYAGETAAVSADSGEKILRWGGDSEGGFPSYNMNILTKGGHR